MRKLVLEYYATSCSSKGCPFHVLDSGMGYCDDEWICSRTGRVFKTEDWVMDKNEWPYRPKPFPDWCPMVEMIETPKMNHNQDYY